MEANAWFTDGLEHMHAALAYRERCLAEGVTPPDAVYIPAEDWESVIETVARSYEPNPGTERMSADDLRAGFAWAGMKILPEPKVTAARGS